MSDSRKFDAKYPGRCEACTDRISVGDSLIWSDELEAAVHFDCAGPRPRPRPTLRPREVCPRCFTEKSVSGACACEEPT